MRGSRNGVRIIPTASPESRTTTVASALRVAVEANPDPERASAIVPSWPDRRAVWGLPQIRDRRRADHVGPGGELERPDVGCRALEHVVDAWHPQRRVDPWAAGPQAVVAARK